MLGHTKKSWSRSNRPAQSSLWSRKGEKDGEATFIKYRVLDFTQVRVGPQVTQWLAVMGAEVIRVETKLRPESFQNDGNPGADWAG